jgi:hypothetical protein
MDLQQNKKSFSLLNSCVAGDPGLFEAFLEKAAGFGNRFGHCHLPSFDYTKKEVLWSMTWSKNDVVT